MAGSYALRGLSKWVTHMLESHSHQPYKLIDSAAAKSLLHGCNAPAGTKVATLDVKEFYMSGDINDLHSDAMSQYEGPHSSLVSEALFLLLDWQYVQARTASPESHVFKVIVGSGMGLPHSGIVASLSFIARIEKWMHRNNILSRYEIGRYGRYHDDIIIVHHNPVFSGNS